LVQWSQLFGEGQLPEITRPLIEQLLAIIEIRHEAGLHILLNAAVALTNAALLTESDMIRVQHALRDLLGGTRYEDVPITSARAVSIPLVRQESVRLAVALKRRIADDGTFDAWIEAAARDPLPEVRFAAAAD
jgi:hypothetical protein